MPGKPFKDYSDKELDEFIEKNEKKLEMYKQLPHHTPETIKSSQETEKGQKEAVAESVRRQALKRTHE